MKVRWTEKLTYDQLLSPDAKDEVTVSVHRHIDGKLLTVMRTKASPDGSLEIAVDVPVEDDKNVRIN